MFLQGIQNPAKCVDFFGFERRVIANIEAVEVNMLDLRVIEKIITKEAAKVRLAELVAATGGASAEFHAALCHGFHTAVAEGVIGFAQDESEGVVAASFKCEVGKIFFAVQLVEEAAQICCADCVVGVEAGEL